MSGHSKWATIKRAKGATDKARGLLFTRLSNAISIAVREGGGVDPESNFKLRLAIDKARAANMPKENIARAVQRGSGEGGALTLESVMYEGFAPGGIGLLIETLTDNKQRSSSEIRNVLSLHGGVLGGVGSVGYLFEQVGQLIVEGNSPSLLDVILLSDARDFVEKNAQIIVITQPTQLHEIQKKLSENGAVIVESELIFRPLATIPVPPDTESALMRLLEALEELTYVNAVYSTSELTAV